MLAKPSCSAALVGPRSPTVAHKRGEDRAGGSGVKRVVRER